MSHKTSDVFRAGDITVDATLNSNESQLIFRARQRPYNPYSGQYYALSSAQIDDPTIRINQYAANGTFQNFGYLYDTQFNPIPPGTRVSVAGGVGDPTQEPNPCIIYSYDNIHWDTWSNPTNLLAGGGCTALAYNGFIFAAGGSAGAANKLLYSANGSTWIASGSESQALCAAGCTNIATNGGFWIAGTSGAHRLIFSFDGINWYASSVTQGGADFYLTTNCRAAAWSGSLWLAGGRGDNNIIRSTDGFFWQRSDNANTLFEQCNAVAWNGSFWLAGGIPATPGESTIAISFDGITWTPIPVTYPTTGTPVYSLSISCNAIGWSGAQWVIGGEDASGNTLAYSYDGTAWYPGTNSTFIVCNAVSWNGNSWAAAGIGANSLVTSFSGADWTPSIEGNRLLIEGGAVAVNKILPNASTVQQITVTTTSSALTLVGASGETVIAFSKDGITWTPSTSAASIFPRGAALAFSWNGFTWTVGIANSLTYTMGNSADGILWSKNATGSSFLNNSCNGITNNNEYWLAGGSGDGTRLIYSVDSNGITWADVAQSHTIFDASATNLRDPGVCNTVGWNGLLWVAGSDCSNNRLAYSYDVSTNWTGSASGNAIFTTSCNSVAWNGLLWVAVGSASNNTSSRAAYSYDGITWTDIADADVKGARHWDTVACNDSVWILGGKQISGDCILFSYDAIHWSVALGTGDFFQNGCTGVTWNGEVWVATGLGSNSVIYSYNGATWVNSYNGDGIFPTGAQSVAANRPQATTGATRPTPTLYAADIPSVGAVTYTPKDARLNSLYPSNTLFLDDIRRNVGINIVPTTHLNVAGSTITPVLDISSGGTGTGIYLESGNGTEPSLSLMNRASAGSRISRIEMLDISAAVGWSIDDLRSTNHLQLTSWNNNQPFTVVDITPGDTGAGQVDINGIDPLAPNGAALFVDGRTNQNDRAISVLGNVNINGVDPSGAALYVNGMDNPADLALNVDGNATVNGTTIRLGTNTVNLTVRSDNASAVQLIGKPNTRFYKDGNANYVEYNGTDFFPSPTNTLNLGLAGNHWNTFYTNIINYDRTDLLIGNGGENGNLVVRTSGVPTQVIGYPYLDLKTGYDGGGIRIDGASNPSSVTPITGAYPISLGSPISPWTNVYATQINPNNSNLIIGGTTNGITVIPSGGAASSIDTEIRANGNRRLVLTSSFNNLTNQYLYWDGSAAFSYPFSASLGVSANPWNNLFAGNINPNSSNLVIGSSATNTGITVLPIASTNLFDSEIRANGGRRLVLSSSYNFGGVNRYLCWDGSGLFPFEPANLGTATDPWANLYAANINPNGVNTLISGTGGVTVIPNSTGVTGVTLQSTGAQLALKVPSNARSAVWNGDGFLPDTNNTGQLGLINYVWSNVWTKSINPTSITLGNYTIVDASGGMGSYTLPIGYTYTISVILVGGGGSGVHWINYIPVNNAGGGSGASIVTSLAGVAGGTVINWTIGANAEGNNNPQVSTVPGTYTATGTDGGDTTVAIVGSALWVAGGGGKGTVVAIRGPGTPFPPPPTSGPTTPGAGGISSVSAPAGTNGLVGGVSTSGYPNGAAGGASVYGGYGAGGDANGGNSGYGYVKIVAIPTANATTPITNRLLGNTQIDSSIYTTGNMGIIAVNTSTNNVSGLNIGSQFILPIGQTLLGSEAYKFTALGARVLYTDPPITVLLPPQTGGYTGTQTISMTVLREGFWLVYAYGNQDVGDMLATFSITIPISSGGFLLGGAMQLNASVNTSVDPTDGRNFKINLGSVNTTAGWVVWARAIMYT